MADQPVKLIARRNEESVLGIGNERLDLGALFQAASPDHLAVVLVQEDDFLFVVPEDDSGAGLVNEVDALARGRLPDNLPARQIRAVTFPDPVMRFVPVEILDRGSSPSSQRQAENGPSLVFIGPPPLQKRSL